MDSYPREPEAVTLDIDDTCDVVHGHQQLSLFNAHYDERCFPAHPCLWTRSAAGPVAVVLRPGKTPIGRRGAGPCPAPRPTASAPAGPRTRILLRGDGHYAPARSDGVVREQRLAIRLRPARLQAAVEEGRGHRRCRPHRRAPSATSPPCGTTPKPGTGPAPGNRERRARGAHRGDTPRPRHPLSSSPTSSAARPSGSTTASTVPEGQAENLIKLHKSQLRSDRTLVPLGAGQPGPPRAAHRRLLAHAGRVRDAIPKVRDLAKAEFTTLRLRLLKVAARIVETRHRVRIAFATACSRGRSHAGPRPQP